MLDNHYWSPITSCQNLQNYQRNKPQASRRILRILFDQSLLTGHITSGQLSKRNRRVFSFCYQRVSLWYSTYYVHYLPHSEYPKFKYLLTPWCTVLLEKLTGLQLIKKFPAFHGTRMFITALTSVRHLSLS